MRFATFVSEGTEHFGLVLRDPRSGNDWVFDPQKAEALAHGLGTIKGWGYRWLRPRFMEDKSWPRQMAAFLALGDAGMAAARRMCDFLARFWKQGDPVLLHSAGYPVAQIALQAPIPRPRLVLGVVGNNSGFLRMDTARGRNLHMPACHQRPQTSVIGSGQPIVIPRGNAAWGGTTELGVVIGKGGRDITRQAAMEHVAGYTVVNDGSPTCYKQRWEELEGSSQADRSAPFHFHASNTASWLGKDVDTMCAIGPYLVTKEELGNPYDLMAYYREGGVLRNRSHSSTLCCGIEELIYWVSQFIELEPGMVLHMGAMGRDGIWLNQTASFGPDYCVEAEIERVGVLRNPIVALDGDDWRAETDPGRSVHPAPVVRALIAGGRDVLGQPEDWDVHEVRHFWAAVANYHDADKVQGIAPKPYPMLYSVPPTALAAAGAVVRLPPHARTITATCELGIVVRSLTERVSAAEAPGHILGYVALAVLRDSSFADGLVQAHILDANMPEIYNRWPDGFNVASALPMPLQNERGREMTVAVQGVGEVRSSTDAYLLEGPTVVAELSRWITLLPGDVISLGRTGPVLTIPAEQSLPEGTRLRASITGIGEVAATLDDQRLTATIGEQPEEGRA